jgi:hypothetical protein
MIKDRLQSLNTKYYRALQLVLPSLLVKDVLGLQALSIRGLGRFRPILLETNPLNFMSCHQCYFYIQSPVLGST